MSDWSENEVHIVVKAYLKMLQDELVGLSVNKSAVRREVLPQLEGRSNGSLEFKNCNISAALLDLGCPAIDGYKPRWNYQKTLLPKIVSETLEGDELLQQVIANYVTSSDDISKKTFVLSEEDPPEYETDYCLREETQDTKLSTRKVNYLEVEARNRALGLQGEKLVFEYERSRLFAAGMDNFANRVEHVAFEKGDGAGFDIRSFDRKGKDRFIEVKTTRFSKHTPFFITKNEVSFSKSHVDFYQLYRVFNFRKEPKLFILDGDVSRRCLLTPSVYSGSFGV